MRYFHLHIALAAIALGAPVRADAAVVADAPRVREIDAARSKAQFSIQHIFVDRVAGTVAVRSGTIELPATGLLPIRVTAELDATQLKTDEPDRDTSLQSPDYFDVKLYPIWTFSSTQIVATGSQAFEMDGLLTMHGVTRPEKLAVRITGDADHPAYHASGPIDRHAFGMRGARLDPVIGDMADVTLDVVVK